MIWQAHIGWFGLTWGLFRPDSFLCRSSVWAGSDRHWRLLPDLRWLRPDPGCVRPSVGGEFGHVPGGVQPRGSGGQIRASSTELGAGSGNSAPSEDCAFRGCLGAKGFGRAPRSTSFARSRRCGHVTSETQDAEVHRQWRGPLPNRMLAFLLELRSLFCADILSWFLVWWPSRERCRLELGRYDQICAVFWPNWVRFGWIFQPRSARYGPDSAKSARFRRVQIWPESGLIWLGFDQICALSAGCPIWGDLGPDVTEFGPDSEKTARVRPNSAQCLPCVPGYYQIWPGFSHLGDLGRNRRQICEHWHIFGPKCSGDLCRGIGSMSVKGGLASDIVCDFCLGWPKLDPLRGGKPC